MISGFSSNQLIFESWNERSGAKCQRVVCSFSAFKSFTINKSFEIDCCDITVFCSTVFYCNCSGVFLLFFLQFSFNVFVCYFCFRLRNFYTFVLTKSNFRFNSNFCCEDECFSRLSLCYIDFRLGNDFKITFFQCFAVVLWNQSVCSVFKEDSFSVHLLDHFSRCFTFTEARKSDSSFCFLVCSLHSFL